MILSVRQAWNKGCNFEDLTNGFGEAAGTFGDMKFSAQILLFLVSMYRNINFTRAMLAPDL